MKHVGTRGGAKDVVSQEQLNFLAAGTGAATRTLQDKAREWVSVKDFGAVGDGTTDDSAAFTAAFAASNDVRVPYSSAGYVVNGVTMASNKSLRGEGRVKLISTATYCLRIQSTSVSALFQHTISDLTINMAGASSGSAAILFATSLGVVFGVRLKRIHFTNCYAAISDESHATNYVVDVMADDCLCTFTRGLQVQVRRSRGFVTLRDFKVDHTYNTGQVTWGGISILDFIGVELEKVDVVGPTIPTATYQSGAVGIILNGSVAGAASVWLTRVLVDNTRGPGVQISSVTNVFSDFLCIFQNLGSALDLSTVVDSTFSNTVLVGGSGLTGVAAGANGITMTSCNRLQFTNLQSRANTGSAVSMNNSSGITINGVTVKDNGGNGVVQLGTSDRNLIIGLRASANTGANLVQIGAGSACVHWYNNSTYRAADVGVITV